MLQKLKLWFHRYISLGTDTTTSLNDLKKIQLLHVFCNTWHLFSILSVIEDLIRGRLTLFIGCCYIIMVALVIAVQLLLVLQKTTKAGVLFIFNIYITVLFFCNYIVTGELLEYFFLLPPSIGLIYINNNKINIAILILCLFALFLPNLYFKHYPYSVINNMNPSFLFFSLFIVFSYFKNLNFRNEKILEAKTKELEELDQFKSQFFTNISHEIRTPLTLINGYISDLNLNTKKNKEIEENLKKQIHKITDLVDSVLNLAKMQSSNFSLSLKQVNVSELIKKQYLNFEPLFKQKKIDFEIVNTTNNYFSSIDIVFFEKAINNLLINALKYTHTGKVNIHFFKNQEQLIIKISDTGIGIAEADIKNVFKRFYQINNDINQAGGSGVGLAFCKEIIELHHGEINLKSELGKGSEFTITMPLEKKTQLTDTQEKTITDHEILESEFSENLATFSKDLVFLIVDDNYDMRTYLKSILKNNHYFEAENGFEALNIVANNKIDFIITDYMMPKLNGYELIYKLNENNYNIPVIMLTAKTDINTKLDVLKLGVNDYISKPFNKNELLTRIENCIKNNTERKSYNKNNNITTEPTYKDIFIEQLKEYIIKNANNTDLNQDTISEHFNTSKSSFYRKIKSTTGLTPNNFIREVRFKKARNILLEDSEISLKKLSLEVGFQHTSYFSKVYKNRFGIKPTKKI